MFRSVRGTVRGKRNLVKAGIASFLLDQNIKVYIYTDTDRNIKVYIYTDTDRNIKVWVRRLML